MTDYTELVKALRERARRENEWYEQGGDIINDAADAIEALQAELGKEGKRVEHLLAKVNELEDKMPKRGEIVRCGECAHCYSEGFVHERNICEKHPEFVNVPDDWFCADGERKVQE